jgi:hypothetical protein
MAKPFKSTRRGITGTFEPGEVRLLGSLFSDIITMLEPETAASTDPLAAMVGVDAEAVRRRTRRCAGCFRRVRDNDDEALEFRRLTERSLREQKIGALRSSALLSNPTPSRSTRAGAADGQAFNDVRLVLATGWASNRRGRREAPRDRRFRRRRGCRDLPRARLQLRHVAAGIPAQAMLSSGRAPAERVRRRL